MTATRDPGRRTAPARCAMPPPSSAARSRRAMAPCGGCAAARRSRPGELSDAQYGLLFGLREHSDAAHQRAGLAGRPVTGDAPPRCSTGSRLPGWSTACAPSATGGSCSPSLTERGQRGRRRAPRAVRAALARQRWPSSATTSCAPPPPCSTACADMFDELTTRRRAGVCDLSRTLTSAVEVRRSPAGVAHAEGDLRAVRPRRLGELDGGRQQDRPLETRPRPCSLAAVAESQRRQAAGLGPHPVGDGGGKPNRRAVSGCTWIGLRSPETEP